MVVNKQLQQLHPTGRLEATSIEKVVRQVVRRVSIYMYIQKYVKK